MDKSVKQNELAPASYDFNCFGDRLRYCLDQRDMTQGELAQIVGLTKAAISQFCAIKKRSGNSKKMGAMATALGVGLLWLQYGAQEGEESTSAPVLAQSSSKIAKGVALVGLSALQEATLQNLGKLMVHGAFDDMACLDLLTQLKPKLEQVK